MIKPLQLFFVTCIGLFSIIAGAEKTNGSLVVITSFPESLFKHYRKGFLDLYPDIELHFLNKKTPAAISAIQNDSALAADVFWASAPDAFEVLKNADLLSPNFKKVTGPTHENQFTDPMGMYSGFAISSYGLIINQQYLDKNGLPVPASWKSLRSPVYADHIGISSPSRSGTTHLIIEMILQHYGWQEGWAIILEMAGNLATITARSYSVPEGVIEGQYGIGLVIDFFALSAQALGHPVNYVLVPESVYLPASIALLKNAANPQAAKQFIKYVLSEQGQQLLLISEISRVPVDQALSEKMPAHYPNPWKSDKLLGGGFDSQLSQQRYQLVNVLFDRLITFRLDELKRSWKLLHQAESKLEKVQASERIKLKNRQVLFQARVLLSSPPISEKKAGDKAFSQLFSPTKPSLPTATEQLRWETEWNREFKANLARARQLSEEVLRAIE